MAAREALWLRDVHVVLVSRALADELRVWSRPVELMVEPRDGSLVVDLMVREFPTEELIS